MRVVQAAAMVEGGGCDPSPLLLAALEARRCIDALSRASKAGKQRAGVFLVRRTRPNSIADRSGPSRFTQTDRAG